MRSSLTRKERRKIQQRMTLSGNLKKGAAVVGTVTAVTAVSPLLPVHNVHAEETDSSVVAPYDATEETGSVETQNDETVTEDANTEPEVNRSYSETEEQQPSSAEDQTSYAQGQEQSQTADERSQLEEQQEGEEAPAEEDEQYANEEDQIAEEEAQTTEEEETYDATEEMEELELPEDEDAQLQEEVGQHPGDNNGPAVSTFSSNAPEPSAFIEELAGHAESVAAANNLYASVMIAQAVVESGWGSSTLSQAPNNNLFGIKGTYNGQSVKMPTQEYINGRYVTVNADFRKYPSYTASFQDNAALLSTNLYSGAWKSNTSSYRDATAALTGLYATAPNYNTVLNGVIEDYNLTRFDTGDSDGIIDTGTGNDGNSSEDNNNNNEDNSNNENSSSNSGSNTYTVRPGDSVWLIANNNGISMDQLRSWNNIQNDFVYPGQELTVSQGNNSSGSNNSNNSGSSNDNNNSSSSGSDTYTVRSGDSVWLIANNNGISMDQLRSWNNIQNDFVYPGQELTVSQGNSSSGSNNSNSGGSSNSGNNSGGSYTVRSGDSVWLIANNNGISMDQLRSWNNIQNDFVYPGQTLTVNNGSSSNRNTNQSNNSSNNNHRVTSGDSLWMISQEYGIAISQLKSINNLNSDTIFIGQTLRVS
ncbi:LysM peptidoglycan-binding domain-containing protein [Tetragenococcus muriaticus]|uniref:LysM peptidoglycan-binding domain-containing protein n=1 Tax=Tetragenococcus muriaticus TaxID=64642 RepID=UPI00041BDAA2|nr:LysM peptidoglycan-binding domain-containing protein [Tetragenococcus muriaticus]GMA48306.1 hypothetical protein GCM10025854_25560 [Tetragenococcus muriaticus]